MRTKEEILKGKIEPAHEMELFTNAVSVSDCEEAMDIHAKEAVEDYKERLKASLYSNRFFLPQYIHENMIGLIDSTPIK